MAAGEAGLGAEVKYGHGVLLMSVHTGLLTVEEFLKLPEPQEGHLELHHGEVVIMPPPKKGHQKLQDRIQILLKGLAGEKAVVRMEMAFRPTPEHEVWQADVGCVSLERDDATGDDEYLMGSPELVVEVLSPSNTMDEILERQDICLANGCVSFGCGYFRTTANARGMSEFG